MEIEEINKLGKELMDILDLETSPVAVGLVNDEKDIPEGIQKIGEATRHCQMIDNVRRTGSQFYTTAGDHQCKGGAAVMGLGEMSEKLKSGELYFNLNHFGSLEAAKSTMENIPHVDSYSVKAILYAPLEKANFVPDVVVIVTPPRKVMQLSQAVLHTKGGRINSSFAGKQSLCGDGVALPYLSGEAGVTIGCSGSRKYTQIEDEEMIISVPVDKLQDMVSAAKAMFN
ncbi:DUF169 domain-containing protein [Methanolobus halotolerans]|uniref:DUF169 domain-containing protein n=1 Tax=Methanolobus halotolerans TaxID=2052935 RepID=A0A4E0Q3U5_9EURY|nr:DUF169 domain-containing protein [Methanolobus halotolerans]TGC08329.1 hypothetical protein CUN85_09640 [Methanolobus halotolerans]